ncbi:unnamed protein product, partial [Anisakis simplex]|uniref:Integrase_H2C2 domain-containing protein n=1 Tax=Anisakis simplex TaxID=6269 RepID=A0A0M3K8V5_ANISI
MQCHKIAGHSGMPQTLCKFRERFWTPHSRSTINRIIRRKCILCKKWNAKPFQLRSFPQLPAFRTMKTSAFQNVGLDYMGPLMMKEKRWISLFTCSATRAIHLKPAESLSAEEFLHCLRRFVTRSGTPECIISDNATNFTL